MRLDVSDETGNLSAYVEVLDVWKQKSGISIFANRDVDGTVAAESLTALLKREGLAYSLVFVGGVGELHARLQSVGGGRGWWCCSTAARL